MTTRNFCNALRSSLWSLLSGHDHVCIRWWAHDGDHICVCGKHFR